MTFYNELSKYYKYIFPTNPTTLDFLGSQFSKDGKILDMACGSGEYTIGLSKLNYQVVGMDLEKEMISKAQEKAKENGLALEFKLGNMLNTQDIFESNTFGGIFCIGNSLVHLDNNYEIEGALKNMHTLLNVDGVLVLQIINYDRILKFNVNFLPTIKNEQVGIEFIRNYIREDNKILFNTVLKTADGNAFENTVKLLPLTSMELVHMLEKVGFNNIVLYGGFNGSNYNSDESMPLVITCKK